MNYAELALELHEKFSGKIATEIRDKENLTAEKLSAYYTPGVAEVSRQIAENPANLRKYTWTKNLVAVISDGSAVLGLGDIGPKAAMPVMEGKALLFKHFAGIDAVPIVLDVHEPEEIIATVKAIAPSFGAINLEDIAAPKCFAIEEKLKNELDIPVFHDDQHGTAIVALAGLINATKITSREFSDLKIVISGAGAAGVAIAKLLRKYADLSVEKRESKAVDAEPNGEKPEKQKNLTVKKSAKIYAVDSTGAIFAGRENLNASKIELLKYIDEPENHGKLDEIIAGANVFVGVSRPGVLTEKMVQKMAPNPIIFALANPDPEILPDVAKKAGAAVVATGRSDFANQVNNALAFPGIFRGALDHNVRKITDEHKIAAAETLAKLVENPTPDEIIPLIFAENLAEKVAAVIK